MAVPTATEYYFFRNVSTRDNCHVGKPRIVIQANSALDRR
jgi:hypothetical protein